MKIQIVRVDGGVETINLVGKITAYESDNQSSLHVEATGADHFFREDGRYDGWGMSVAMSPEEALDFIAAVESERETPPEESSYD